MKPPILQQPLAFDWIPKISRTEWILILAGIVILLLLLFLLLRPLLTKRKMKKKSEEATALQQKDLMSWQNIAAMAADQTKRDTVKQSLSSKLKTIRMLFQQGLDMQRKSGRNRGLPWLVLLGEPGSGKSELLGNSDLSLKCSAEENETEEGSLPLRFWLGRGLTLDVSGHIFFDRWFNGSCAEWILIRDLIRKKHHKVPVNGIILVIPADALIADSDELTKRKVSLIATELNNFLFGLGMILPCYVVITKLDMILGFQEYFRKLDDQHREKAWGWRNPASNGCFDAVSFTEYFDGLRNKLRDGSFSLLMDESGENRLDTTSGMYLFPDEFARIRRNLLTYLNNLFGRRSWMDGNCAKMAGVYFTASKCGHHILSPDFAGLQQKPVEEAVLTNRNAGPQHSFFVKELLDDLIFSNRKCYEFTAAEQFRRNLGKYVLCILMAAVSIWFTVTAWNSNGKIRDLLATRSAYYAKTAEFFDKGILSRSPMITRGKAPDRIAVSHDESLADHDEINRLMYFYESQLTPGKNSMVPWGFRTSQFLLFRDFNCDQEEQDFVSSRIQTEMVFKPAFRLFTDFLVTTEAEKESFTDVKREAFIQMHRLKGFLPGGKHASSPKLITEPYLRYLAPGLSVEQLDLFNMRAGKVSEADRNDIAELVYSLDYQKASLAVTRQFLSAWKSLEIYPNDEYNLLRQVIRKAYEMHENYGKIHTLAVNVAINPNPEKMLAELQSLIEQQNRLIADVNMYLASPSIREALQPQQEKTDKVKEIKRKVLIQDIFSGYEKRMKADFGLIRTYGAPGALSSSLTSSPETGNDILESVLHDAQGLFATEKDELTKKFSTLQATSFFMTALPKAEDGTVVDTAYVGQVQLELLNLLIRPWQRKAGRMESPSDFIDRFQALQKARAEDEKAFSDFAARYAANKDIAALAKEYQAFISLQYTCLNNDLIKELFAFYPATPEQFMNDIAATSGNVDPESIGMKPDLAKESFGDLTISKYYTAQTALAFVAPVTTLLEAAKNKKGISAEQQAEITRIARMLDSYFDQYIQYWGTFTDKIPVSFASWTEFREESRTRKAYQTNTLLLASYVQCRDNIQQIPDQVLSEAVAAKKKQMIALLNTRIQILSPDFAQSCANVCNAWATLPKEADAAFGILQSLSPKQLRTDYLLVFGEGAKGDIPWWSNWMKAGLSLLFRDAKEQLYKQFETYRPKLFSFPLCKDAPYTTVLNEAELLDVSQYLAALGCPVPSSDASDQKAGTAEENKDKAPAAAEEKKQDDAPGKDQAATEKEQAEKDALEQLFGKDMESLKEWTTWGGKIQVLLDGLANKVKPLTYTLTIPSEAEQKNLTAKMERPLPLAIYRFPYIRASNQTNGTETAQFHLNGDEIPKLLSGLVSDPSLKLEFNSFSADSAPDCTRSFEGEWAVLKLYLSDDSGFDPKTKKAFSALILQDDTGKSYVLWIGFEFNKAIPLPSEWPSADNCPDFSQTQTAARKKPLNAQQWSQEIQKAGTGDAGYDKLLETIRTYPADLFPACKIVTDGNLETELLETPFLEVVSPNDTVRIPVLVSGKTIPLDLNVTRYEIRLYRFSDDKEPVSSATISGPHALLRLLTGENRKLDKDVLVVPVPMKPADGSKPTNLNLRIQIGGR